MDDEALARLLSGRNRPSVLEKEAGAARVIAQLQRERRHKRLWVSGGVLAAAAALVLVFLRPTPSDERASTFTARGQPGSAAFLVGCSATRATCAPGETLGFEILHAGGHSHFAAFARRDDGVVIWYFPEPGGDSRALLGAGERLSTGVTLGAEHRPGVYQVFGVFSSTPLTREMLKERLGPELNGRAGITVVQKNLRVVATP